jgi:hypothetical protein
MAPPLGGRVVHNVAITTDCPPKQATNLNDQCAPGAPDLPKRATVDQPSRRDDAQPQSSPTAKPRRIPRGQHAMVMMDRPGRRAQRLMSRGMPARRGARHSHCRYSVQRCCRRRGACFELRSKRPYRNRGHVVDRVEKQRTNDRLLADQRRGGVSLRNPLECLVANRLRS